MFKHILAATDGTELSSGAVTMAARLARAMGAKLTVMHARQQFIPLYPAWSATYMPALDQEEFDKAVKTASEEVLAGARRLAAGEQVDCSTVSIASEVPWQAIIDCAARERCDAIVMASHGRKGVQALLLGSETYKVLTHSTLPVMVTR